MTAFSLSNGGDSNLVLPQASAKQRGGDGHDGVPCVYCRLVIPSAKFAFWSDAKRLLSADCPACGRRVTLATSTWRRWLGPLATDVTAHRKREQSP